MHLWEHTNVSMGLFCIVPVINLADVVVVRGVFSVVILEALIYMYIVTTTMGC